MKTLFPLSVPVSHNRSITEPVPKALAALGLLVALNLHAQVNTTTQVISTNGGQAVTMVVVHSQPTASATAGSISPLSPGPGCTPCPDGAAAWWAAEGDASDSLCAHNGTVHNSVGYVQGQIGQAFSFTGSGGSGFVDIANSGLIFPSWSFEAWVNPATTVSSQVWLVGQLYGRQLLLRPGTSRPEVCLAVSTSPYNWLVLEGPEITVGAWSHVVGVCDSASGTLKLYVNGEIGASTTLGLVPWDSGSSWSIGGVDYQFLSGGLDEVTIYDAALSWAQVQALYAAGSAGKCPPGQFNVVNVSHMQYHEAEPTIAVNPRLNGSGHHDMYVFSSRPGTSAWGAPAGLMASASTDGGQTWPSPAVFATGASPANLPVADGGDVCAVYDSQGNLFISYITGLLQHLKPYSVVVAELPANTATWSRLDNGAFTTESQGIDQPWLAVGPAPAGSPGAETLWLCYSDQDAANNGFVKATGAFVDSAGNVGGFAPLQKLITDPGVFPDVQRIAVGPAGQVICTWLNMSPWGIYYSFSDTGLTGTFSTPSVAFSGPAVLALLVSQIWDTPVPAQNHRGISNCPMLAWDRSGKTYNGRSRIYVAYTDYRVPPYNWPHTDIYVEYADYNPLGMTWYAGNNNGLPLDSPDNATTQFFPAIAVDQSNGNVAVGWYDDRCDPVNRQKVQYYAAVSRDGGSSFGQSFQLTSGLSDSNLLDWNGHAQQDFLDYTAVAYVGGVLYAAWADNSDNPPNFYDGHSYLDIYVAFGIPPCP